MKNIVATQQTESDPDVLWMNYMQLFYRVYTYMNDRYRQSNMGVPITWNEFNQMKELFEQNLSTLKNSNEILLDP